MREMEDQRSVPHDTSYTHHASSKALVKKEVIVGDRTESIE